MGPQSSAQVYTLEELNRGRIETATERTFATSVSAVVERFEIVSIALAAAVDKCLTLSYFWVKEPALDRCFTRSRI